MIVSIHQPDYIPYLGYYYKISKSDRFVFLDDAQFSSDNIHNWNRIKTPQGECRLKIPVEYHFGDGIHMVRTKDELKWKEKQLKTIEMNYKKARCFKETFPDIRDIIMEEHKSLADLNIALTTHFCRRFGFRVEFYRSSDMHIMARQEERVIEICSRLGAAAYLSGNGARAYQSAEHFSAKGIELVYTDYKPIQYEQLWKDFIPNMSVLDFILNCGYDWEYFLAKLGEAHGNR